MFKKIIALLLCVCLCVPVFSAALVTASAADGALSINDGIDELRDQFKLGVGATVDNKVMDYYYYSPVYESSDTTKYPLVVWLHGLVSGGWPGRQITKNDISYWSSREFQARFRNAGGAYIFVPRSTETVSVWGDDVMGVLKETIDYFIMKNYGNIDTTRIYIGGLSMGGKMALKMVAAYPDMFAAAFPCSPYYTPTEDIITGVRNTPIWQLSSKDDCYMNYNTNIKPSWDRIMAASNCRTNCRLSVFETTYKPNGVKTSTTHDTWYACTYDMFMEDNSSYYQMSTYNGDGYMLRLYYPYGMISWLSKFHSNYSVDYVDVDNQSAGAVRVAWALIIAIIANVAKSIGLVGIIG